MNQSQIRALKPCLECGTMSTDNYSAGNGVALTRCKLCHEAHIARVVRQAHAREDISAAHEGRLTIQRRPR